MTKFDLTPCHPMLLALHVLATDDGFQLTMAGSHQTTYTRSHAGWTTRVCASVLLPECTCTFDSRSEACNGDATEEIQLEVETELDGLGIRLCGDVTVAICDAVWSYVGNVRTVAHAFPLHLLRTRLRDIDPTNTFWPDTPFLSFQVLAYLASIHWQLGDRKRAADCYARLRDYGFTSQKARVQQRIEELGCGVAFENRARTSISGL